MDVVELDSAKLHNLEGRPGPLPSGDPVACGDTSAKEFHLLSMLAVPTKIPNWNFSRSF